jgi:hypothetical protein
MHEMQYQLEEQQDKLKEEPQQEKETKPIVNDEYYD